MPTKRYRNRHLEIDTIALGGYDENVAETKLMLDRETTTYWAEYAGTRIEDKDAEAVKRQITELLRGANTVTWQGYIEVTWSGTHQSRGAWGDRGCYAGDREGAGSVSFSFERHLYARFPDGKLRRCYWGCPPEHRLINAHAFTPKVYVPGEVEKKIKDRYYEMKRGEFVPPCRGADFQGNAENRVYLPHSDDLWHGLTLLVDATKQLSERLAELLGTTEGHARLAAAALPFALPAPVSAAT